jgi:type I restriction enzyme S subunit
MTFRNRKLKYCCSLKGRIGWQNLRNDEFTDEGPLLITGMHFSNGGVDWDKCFHISPERYAVDHNIHVREGDLLITKDGSIGKLAYIGCLPGPACLNSHLLIIRPRNGFPSSRFLFYLLKSERFERYILDEQSGTTFYGLSQESIANFDAAFPESLQDQLQIAQFLDDATFQIDDLIAKKQRLIDLLDEKRAAQISHAVTKGLEPGTAMKETGITWLGPVPGSWEEHRLSELAVFTSGSTPSIERLDYWDGDILWASAKDMKAEFINGTADHISMTALHEWGMSLIQPPAVLLVVRGMILAHSLPVAVSQVPLTINQDMKVLQVRPNCSPEFLMRWFQGVKHGLAALIEPSAHGTRCLRSDLLKRVRCFLPDRGEQDRICRYIAAETAKLQDAAGATAAVIEKLREYRAALITAAVTGQLDLPKQEKQMEAIA